MHIGQVIERERLARGVSAAAFAKISGISRDALYSIEAGECSPTMRTLQKIGAAFRIKAWELMRKAS